MDGSREEQACTPEKPGNQGYFAREVTRGSGTEIHLLVTEGSGKGQAQSKT